MIPLVLFIFEGLFRFDWIRSDKVLYAKSFKQAAKEAETVLAEDGMEEYLHKLDKK